MALSSKTITYAGGPQVFNIAFALGVLETDHLSVQVVGDVDGLGDPVEYAFTYDPNTGDVTVTDTLTSGDVVFISRTTPIETLLVDFEEGADVSRRNVGRAVKQAIMIAQEVVDSRAEDAASVAELEALYAGIQADVDAAEAAAIAAGGAATNADASADEAAGYAASINPALLLAKADNLSGLASPSVARTNLGITSKGSEVATAVNAADVRVAADAQQASTRLTEVATAGPAGSVKMMGSGGLYINRTLIGTRRVELTPVDNPAGVSGVGYDFDWPAPPAGEPAYDINEIVGHFFGTGPTAAVPTRLVMQLKVDGVRVPQDYAGTGITTGMALPQLTGPTAVGIGHSTIYRFPQKPRRWMNNSGGSATTALLDLDTPWVTAKTYAVGACVGQGGLTYRCISAHTSGVFATDLAFPRWVVTTGLVTGIGIFQQATTFNGLGSLGVSFVG